MKLVTLKLNVMLLKFILRNLSKRPFLNLIKIIGLSLALSGLLLIVLYLNHELNYDKSFKNHKQIFRLTTTNENFFGGKHFARMYYSAYIPLMKEKFPEIENYVRLSPLRGGFIKHGEKFFEVSEAFECDSTFFDIFNCELITGDSKTILNSPGSAVISESYARKIFGNENPVGKVLIIPAGQFYGENKEFTIKGIMKDFNRNNHFHPEFIASTTDENVFNGWSWNYLKLKDIASTEKIISGFKEFYSSVTGIKVEELKIEAHLQNIADIHLHSDKLREIEPNGNITVIYTIAIAALILLFISLTNYANLNIGMTFFSDKFLYMNKLSGASERIDFKYFLLEGIIVAFISVVLSFITTELINVFIQKDFGINFFTGNLGLVIIVYLIFIVLCLIAGIFPLINGIFDNLSSFFSSRQKGKLHKRNISKSLIVLQYAISIILIIAVVVIFKQTRYALSNSMGVDNKKLICFENVHTNIQNDFKIFKNELLKYETIESVSAMFEPPGGEANDMFEFKLEGYIADETNNLDKMIGVFPCDYSFPSIFNLNFLSGKNFSENSEDMDGAGEYIINKSALKRLKYQNPDDIIGKEFSLIFNFGDIKIPKGKIIGVVDDFHFSSMKKEIEPLVFFKRNAMWISNFIVSFRSDTSKKALNDIKNVWNNLYSQYPFEYEYVDNMYKNVYKAELVQVRLLTVFTFVALLIGSMGLLGMSLLSVQRRTKEIGIRKVNGAGISNIIMLLNWDIVKWIIISFIIAAPFAYYLMQKWLGNFAYKIEIKWWIFTIAGIITILISVLTITFISWKAARNNPVNALRYE